MALDAATLLAEQNALVQGRGPSAGRFFRYRCAALAARQLPKNPPQHPSSAASKSTAAATSIPSSSASSLAQQPYQSFDETPIHGPATAVGGAQRMASRSSRRDTADNDASGYRSHGGNLVAAEAHQQPHASSSVLDIASVPLKPPGHQEPNFASATEDAVSGVAAQAPGGHRMECSVCGRLFAQDRIEKHQNACAKTTQTERKAFDVRQVRVQNVLAANMAENDVQRVLGGDADPEVERKMQLLKAKKASWRQQSAALQSAMRSARGDGGGQGQSAIVEDDLRVLCSGCGRKFSPETAETHIPRCIERARGR